MPLISDDLATRDDIHEPPGKSDYSAIVHDSNLHL
jgi:hypothetical protein